MMSDDEYVTVGGCAPFGIATPDGDVVDSVDEKALRVAVTKQHMGIVLHLDAARTDKAHSNVRHVTEHLSPQVMRIYQPFYPVRRYLPVFLRLLAALLHIVPPRFHRKMQRPGIGLFLFHHSALSDFCVVVYRNTLAAIPPLSAVTAGEKHAYAVAVLIIRIDTDPILERKFRCGLNGFAGHNILVRPAFRTFD